jgi:hypothetical protein
MAVRFLIKLLALLLLIAAWCLVPRSQAWFDLLENWQHCYLAYIDDEDVRPVYHDAVLGGFGAAAIDDYDAYLKAYYRLEEASGDRADDVNAHTMNEVVGVGNMVGKSNNAASFPGVNQYLNEPGQDSDFEPVNSLAISAWIRPQLSDPSTGYVWMKNSSYGLHYTLNSMASTYVNFTVFAVETEVFSVMGALTDDWHHVVAVADQRTTRLYLYIDGVKTQSSGTYTPPITAAIDGLQIGGTTAGGKWKGGIDEAAFWKEPYWADNADRDAFAAALYNSGAGRFYSGGSPAYVDAPDGQTVEVPLTIRVRTHKHTADLTDVKIQWRQPGAAVWTDAPITYTGGTGDELEFNWPACSLGIESVTSANYSKGDAMRIRLYVSDGIYENGDLSQDPDAEGGTGTWLDQYVWSGTAHAVSWRTGRPGIDMTCFPVPP